MKRMKTVRALGAAALGVALAAGSASNALAAKRVKWKMQSAFGSSLIHLGPSGLRFAEDIKKMSDGKFLIKFFEPGALVPALECFDSVSKGSIESCWTTPGYHVGKIPAVAFFTTVPFGPQFGEFVAWKHFGGGNKLREEIYNQYGLTSVDGFCIGPETSGWFRKPITSFEQFKGMKMRFFGLGALVMQKMGVSTQLLAAADIYPALERGVIDATEFSMPTIDIKLGFYQIAKYDYFPGWHQQVSCSEFLMNKAKHDALPESYQTMIKTAAGHQVVYTFAETEAMNPDALSELTEKYGVTIKRWPDDWLAKFEKAWLASDPLFKKVADNYLAFRKKYKIWADAQRLKSSYQ